jgi:hypothetical protein
MLSDFPMSWLLVEALSVVLFVACIAHALKQPEPSIRIFEIIAGIIYTGIFENAFGVAGKLYDYSLHRVLLVGKVPLEILFCEVSIFYVAIRLTEYLEMPRWARPFAVGFLASTQDVSLDPSAVFDRYLLNGIMSGQWNWTHKYDGGLFGIPFYNFSGWIYMMAYYAAATMLGEWLFKKYRRPALAYYPFVAVVLSLIVLVSPVTRFLLFGWPFVPMFTKNAEMAMLACNYGVGLFVLLRYSARTRPFDGRDRIILWLPLILHAYDIGIAFARHIEAACASSLAITALHVAYFIYFLRAPKPVVLPLREA